MSLGKLAQPLTPQEKEILQDLLARSAIQSEEGEPSTPGSFSMVDLQSMSDASNRRTDESEEEQVAKRMFAANLPYMSEGPPQPVLVGKTPRGKPIFLPQDVPNVTTWGRSIIQFGKYSKKSSEAGISYAELYEDRSDPEKVRYVKWVVAQTDSSKGLLLDLATYLCVRSAESAEGSQLPFVPGTSSLRMIK